MSKLIKKYFKLKPNDQKLYVYVCHTSLFKRVHNFTQNVCKERKNKKYKKKFNRKLSI